MSDIPEQTRLSKAMKRIRDLSIGSPTLWGSIERIMSQYGSDCYWEGYDNHKAEAKEKP